MSHVVKYVRTQHLFLVCQDAAKCNGILQRLATDTLCVKPTEIVFSMKDTNQCVSIHTHSSL